jgi:hypothetical protein
MTDNLEPDAADEDALSLQAFMAAPMNAKNQTLQPVPMQVQHGVVESTQGPVGAVTFMHPAGEFTLMVQDPQRLNEYWSGTAPIPCPSTRLFRGVVTNARLSPYGSPLNDGPDTWTWTNPFAGEWVSKAGHVKWGMNPTVAPSSNGPFWVFAVPAC